MHKKSIRGLLDVDTAGVEGPTVLHVPTRKSKAYFGGVRINKCSFICCQFYIFDTELFKVFMENLLKVRQRGKKVLVILNNARYHHAEERSECLDKNRNRMKLLFLPPYKPLLNPVEQFGSL